MRLLRVKRLSGATSAALVALSVLISSGAAGCVPHGAEPKTPESGVVAAPAPIADADFARKLHDVLRTRADADGSSEGAGVPVAVRLGVVKQALSHASIRFARGADERALVSVLGAFYLLRSEDHPSPLVDAATIGAIDGALQKVSGRGDSGKARVLYGLERDARRAGAVPGDAASIEKHLADLDAYVRDIQKGKPIEIAGEAERAASSRVLLDPSGPALDDAKAAISSFIDLGIQHNVMFRQTGRRPSPEEAAESTRALESGASTLVALYLRAGDLKGAVAAIDSSSARRVIDPAFYRALKVAADRDDGAAWRAIFAELDQETSERGGEIGIDEELLQAAFFNVALEAYRRDPDDLATTLELSRSLAAYGLSEAVPYVLADGVGKATRPEEVSTALKVLGAALDADASAGDYDAAMRTIAASDEFLALADDKLRGAPELHPRVSDLRNQMAEIQIHAGRLGDARASLDQAMKGSPSADGLLELALVSRQLGDDRAALDYAAHAADFKGADPLDVADAETLAFELHRDAGRKDEAARALERALRATLDARRKQSTSAPYRVKVERTMGRVLEAYGENSAAGRAFDRALDQVSGDRGLIGATLLRSMGFCLVTHDVERARATLRKGREAGASKEDLVYAALWLMLLEKQAGVPPDGSASEVFESVASSSQWYGKLSAWAVGRLADGDLMTGADTPENKIEASFYVAMRQRASGGRPSAVASASPAPGADTSAAALKAIAKSSALDLLEVDLARELTAPPMTVPLPKGISIP